MLWRPGKAYPPELRERVLLASDEGARVGQIAKRFKITLSYVSNVFNRRTKTGETSTRPQLNHVPAKPTSRGGLVQAEGVPISP
jgi:transposase